MQDAWRAYLELALGLTETSRKRAQTAVRRLVGQGGATASQLQGLAEELLSTGLANRETLTKLVRFEVDRALGRVGLATADEVAELTGRVHRLERELREARGSAAPGGGVAPAASAVTPQTAAPNAVVKRAVAKKAVAKKAVAKKTVAKRSSAGLAGTETAGALGAAAPVKKAVVSSPGTKKITPKKLPAVAKKTAPRKLPPGAGPV